MSIGSQWVAPCHRQMDGRTDGQAPVIYPQHCHSGEAEFSWDYLSSDLRHTTYPSLSFFISQESLGMSASDMYNCIATIEVEGHRVNPQEHQVLNSPSSPRTHSSADVGPPGHL